MLMSQVDFCKQYTVHMGAFLAFAHSSKREHAFSNYLAWLSFGSSHQGSCLRFEKKSFVVSAICNHRLHGHTHALLCTRTPLSTSTTRRPMSLIAVTRQRTPHTKHVVLFCLPSLKRCQICGGKTILFVSYIFCSGATRISFTF